MHVQSGQNQSHVTLMDWLTTFSSFMKKVRRKAFSLLSSLTFIIVYVSTFYPQLSPLGKSRNHLNPQGNQPPFSNLILKILISDD